MNVAINGIDATALPPPGANGQVLTLVSDAPAWANGGGRGTHGEGTLDARPVIPEAGDSYEVTEGLCEGDQYACLTDGAWTFIGRGSDRRFASGQGFSLVSPGTNPNAGTSVASFEPNGIARLSIATAGTIHDATGCVIRRELAWGAALYRASVRLVARGAYSGSSFGGLYVSDSSGSSVFLAASGLGNGGADEFIAGNWSSLYDPRVAGAAPWDGATLLTLQIQASVAGTYVQGGFMRAGVWTRWGAGIAFTPAFVGVCGVTDGPASTTFDFADLSVASFG